MRISAAVLSILLIGSSLTALEPRLRQAPPSQRAGSAAVSGVVVDGETGRPLTGVVVRVFSGGTRRVSIVDSKGRFVFDRLPSGSYHIETGKPGYVAEGLSSMFVFFPRQVVSLDEGEWVADLRLTMVRLGSITGTVREEDGQPAVGVTVRSMVPVPIAGVFHWAFGPIAKTDDRGMFRLAGLRHGRYVVLVSTVVATVPTSAAGQGLGQTSEAPLSGVDLSGSRLLVRAGDLPPAGWMTRAYPTTYYPNSRSLVEAVPVELADEETVRGIDFVLNPVETASITGRLVGPPGAISDLPIRLIPAGMEDVGYGAEQATALSSFDGSFTFLNVPVGRYQLVVGLGFGSLAVGGMRPTTTPGLGGNYTGNEVPALQETGRVLFERRQTMSNAGYGASVPVVVDRSGIAGLTVTMERLSTLSGTIVRENGEPPSRTGLVFVDPADGSPASGAPYHVTAGADGSFVIRGVGEGKHFLRPAGMVKSITSPVGDHTDQPFDVQRGVDIPDIVVTLASRVASLSGIVRDRQGRPAGEAAVIAFPADATLWANFGFESRRIQTATSFAGDPYLIPRLPAGDYLVVAVPTLRENAWQLPGFLAAAAPLATRISLEWGDVKSLDLVIQEVTVGK